MDTGPIPYQKILFVCVNARQPHEACCAHRDGEAIAASLKARIKALGLARMVRVSKSGCQDRCADGPNVMVFPESRWYRGVCLEDVERIVQETVRGLIPATSASSADAAATSNPARI